MPYFNNGIINILLIHIPKTGGSSVTRYFANKYNIKENNKSLYGTVGIHKDISELTAEEFEVKCFIRSRLQHMKYYTDICKYSNYFNINYNNINIITIVRNPYERVMSALFYFNLINSETTPDDVFNILKKYLLDQRPDNFITPQYLFITDEKRELIPNLKILHTENLKNDMSEIGYTDFDININCNECRVDHYKLLNNDSIKLINQIYDIDFRLFNYKKKYTVSNNITQPHKSLCNTDNMSIVINSSRQIIDDALYILNDNNILDTLSTSLLQVDNSSYRLNLESTTRNTLEQYVSQITAFHSSRLNLSYNKTSCVEFSIITPLVNQCNIVYDKPNYEKSNKKNSPICSIITNLGDCTCPLLLTDINHQQYKYKQFTDQSHNKLIFLKKYMHLVFDSSKYHGFVDILNNGFVNTKQPYLLINLWSYSLDTIPYYSSVNGVINCGVHMNFTDMNQPSASQVVDASCLKHEFFDQLLYKSMLVLDDGLITNINTVNTNSTHRIIMQIRNANNSTVCNTVSTHTIPTAASKKENINTWRVSNHKYHDNLLRDIDNFCGGRFLLDLTKSKFTLIEKYVYDIAMFHFARMNIHDIENHAIEFWCKSKFHTHTLHVDCDESLKRKGVYVYPILSCITYLNDVSSCPTIITNVDMDCYKYKDFESQTELILSLPMRSKQITFDGRFFHGSTTLFDSQDIQERYIIAINFWKTKPHDVNFYNINNETNCNDKSILKREETLITLREDNSEICSMNVCSDTINYSLFNDILYNKKADTCYRFNQYIKTNCSNGYDTFKFILDHSIKEDKKHAELKNKYGVIMDDIREISNDKISLKYNRFLQRFSFPKIYSPDMCRYIINECENYAKHNGGWLTTRHHKYPTTDLPVDKIPSIFGIILETLKTITNKISTSYCLHDDMVIDIKDLFIVKYSHDAQNQLEMHTDGSFISFNILLNESSEFEGGGTYFDDGLTSRLEQGDILIHSSKIKHSGLPITSGCRYLLVGFVNISL
jgi:hypothetical protein